MPLERDEGEYSYMGQLILKGIPPYRDAYNLKFPGTYFVYAVIMAVLGQSDVGIRWGLAMTIGATAGGIWWIARTWWNAEVACWAAGIYLVLSLSPGVYGIEAHATHFVSLGSVVGYLCVSKGVRNGSIWWLLASGVSFGLAILAKQHGVIFLPAAVAMIVIVGGTNESSRNSQRKQVFGVCLGAGAIVGIVGIYLLVEGVWPRFWFWTFQYAVNYSSVPKWATRVEYLTQTLTGFWPEAPLLSLAAVGAVRLYKREPAQAAWLLIWLAAALLQVLPGFYFRPHYFIPVFPPVALLAGNCAAWQCGRAYERVALLSAICCILPLVLRREIYFQLSPEEVSRKLYGFNPFPESRVIGKFLKDVTAPDDTIAVIGSEPEIYFYSQRKAATGYLYTYSLMEQQPFAHRMQREMAAEIEARRPKYLVYVVIGMSWLGTSQSDPYIFHWFDGYRQRYSMAGLVALHPEGTEFVWQNTQTYNRKTDYFVSIWKRNGD